MARPKGAISNSPVPKRGAGRPPKNRHKRFYCMVDGDLFDKANSVKGETWPDIVEDRLKEVIRGIDTRFLAYVAQQAIIVLENGQKHRYKLVAKRLRKALNLQGASTETMVEAVEALL